MELAAWNRFKIPEVVPVVEERAGPVHVVIFISGLMKWMYYA